ncbi:MAG: hypothetical protein COB85_02080 [Bacteroidetes bacterium]|nr:MAG: hypothetical protein COB85_02080 [Bacteroidota bacterium]
MEQSHARDKRATYVIIALSIIVPIVVAILMLLPDTGAAESVRNLPLFHATLNGLTAASLLTGFYFIKNGKMINHRFCMILAFALSSVFLVSYIIYHYNTGHTSFGGEGWIRPVYFTLLISHIILATAILPMALLSMYRGLANQISKHKSIAKWTFPIWLYVAISGVLVYLLMRPYYPF